MENIKWIFLSYSLHQYSSKWKTDVTHFLVFSVEGDIRRLRTDLYCDEEATDINGNDEPSNNADMSIDEDKKYDNTEKNDMDVSTQ